jgi:hypothetical protein
MGYRTYIGFLPTEEYNKIKSMTLKELFEYKGEEYNEEDIYENGHVGVYDLGTELYEFGKYTDFTPPETSVKEFFEKECVKEYYASDNDLHIVTKEFLAYIIEYYSQKVKKYQEDMLEPFYPSIRTEKWNPEPCEFLKSVSTEYNHPKDKHKLDFSKITEEQQSALFEIIKHMKDMHFEWALNRRPYNLEKGVSVTNSCKYEYAIFDLVRLYKSFDWDNNIVFYYGY